MKLGFEIEIEDVTQTIPAIPGIRTEADNSLRNGIELISEPLPDINFAHTIYTYIYDTVRGTYSERCGFHFHMDFTDKPTSIITEFLSRYIKLERTLFRLYPHMFRSNNNFCNLLTDSPSELTVIREYAHGNTRSLDQFSKYSALNIKPLHTLGTIEFRAAPAGLSPSDTLQLFTIFNDIYHNTIPESLLSQILPEDLAEAESIITLINTPPEPLTSDLGEYMNTHFDIPTPISVSVPTQENLRQFLEGL